MRASFGRRPLRGVLLVAFSLVISITPVGETYVAGKASDRRNTAGPNEVRIKSLSNRADLISGGNAYIQIVLPQEARLSQLTVRLGRRDVTNAFAVRSDGRILGVVRNLRRGKNELVARLSDGRGARLTITNHPRGGPVFSGRQVRPWICETEASGLSKPKGRKCNAPTKYEFFYKSAVSGQMDPYDPEQPPAEGEIADTTTDQGKTVPFIVRRETGTQNRGVYQAAVLYPRPNKAYKPWAPQPGWNNKLAWSFGVSCGTEHRQAQPVDVMNEAKLGAGFMLANSSLNVLGNNCNTITSAESVMMLKEHIVENYGEIRYTIGDGCSGGSIGQHMVANTYPGLVDGIQPNCSYEDVYSTGNEVVDCHLLLHYFNEISPHLWAGDAQRAAVSGHQTESSCVAWEALFASVPDPEVGCALPEEKTYNAETNPDGARCGTFDFQLALWGRRPRELWTAPEKEISRGFAKSSFDNLGVQYGLSALNSGEVTAEQFVDLNEKIGGVDIDYNFQPDRITSNPGSLRILHRSGQINDAAHLDRVPIIDLRGTSNNEIHTDYHSYSMRMRLVKANGHHDNQLIWTGPAALVGDATMLEESFFVLDEWLSAIEADPRKISLTRKVVLNKPGAAVDACWLGGNKVTDMNKCRAAFPYFGAPRIAAGGPLSHDIEKCARKPLRRADYDVEFSDDQWSRLKDVFRRGVCDYNKPAVGKRRSIPWLTYVHGPGGKRIGPPPRSASFGRN